MEESNSTEQNNSGEKLNKLYSVITFAMLGTAINVDPRPLFWVSREVLEPFFGRETLAYNCHSRAEQSRFHDQSLQTPHQGCTIQYSSLALSSWGEHHTVAESSHTNKTPANIKEKLSTEHWLSFFPSESSKSDVVKNLSSKLFLLKTLL